MDAAAIAAAAERIAPLVRRTPVERCAWLSDETAAEVRFKLECWQRTGSFKLRGAVHRLLLLGDAERARGVVSASTGNHGAGMARAGAELGVPVTVYAPRTASAAKLEAMRRGGAEVVLAGDDCVEAEAAARRAAEAGGRPYVSPYNDPAVVAGQGTVGLELDEQLDSLDAVFVAVGGGGLIGGVAAWLKERRPGVRVIGCSPAASAVMEASVRAGRILDLPSAPTLSDATSGGLEPGSLTFPLCRDLVDDWIQVSEEEIADALLRVIGEDHLLVEGAAAVPVAAMRQRPREWAGAEVAVVLCGANLSLQRLGQLLR
jgi:threonine dehydratase